MCESETKASGPARLEPGLRVLGFLSLLNGLKK